MLVGISQIFCTFARKFESLYYREMSKMKRFLFVFSILGLLFSACQGQKSDGSTEEDTVDSTQVADTVASTLQEEIEDEVAMPKAADELFDDFIFNFAANKKLQSSRIVFPLKVQQSSLDFLQYPLLWY